MPEDALEANEGESSQPPSEDPPGDVPVDDQTTARGLQQINELADSGYEADFLQVLGRHLVSEVTVDTFGDLIESAGTFLDDDAFSYLTWLAHQDSDERFSIVGDTDELTLAGKNFVRKTIGLYGAELEFAWDIWRRSRIADDWKRTSREVTQDIERNRYSIKFQIQKNNRETVLLQGDPNSMIRLADRLVDAIIEVKDSSAFNREYTDEFLKTATELRELMEQESAEADPTTQVEPTPENERN